MSGPPPKKKSERRRRNKPDGLATEIVNVDDLIAGEVEIPTPPTHLVPVDDDDPDGEKEEVYSWHPVALNAYLSLAKSGQVIWMEPSDWATAFALCEMLSRELNPKPIVVTDSDGSGHVEWVKQPVNGAVMNAFLKGWSSGLMATEGDRRKLRIELERRKRLDAAAEGGPVIDIVQRRADAFKGA